MTDYAGLYSPGWRGGGAESPSHSSAQVNVLCLWFDGHTVLVKRSNAGSMLRLFPPTQSLRPHTHHKMGLCWCVCVFVSSKTLIPDVSSVSFLFPSMSISMRATASLIQMPLSPSRPRQRSLCLLQRRTVRHHLTLISCCFLWDSHQWLPASSHSEELLSVFSAQDRRPVGQQLSRYAPSGE